MSEFDFLPAQAAELGVPAPAVQRVQLTLDDGRTLSALRWGAGRPRVTFLHGAGLNAHTWDATLLGLGISALAIDLPGHGDSDWRSDADYTARTLAPDVCTAMDAWARVQDAPSPRILAGQSLGGLVAAAVAASRPDLADSVVLIDITPGVSRAGGPSQLTEFFAGPTSWAHRDELVQRALSFGLGGSRTATERGVFHNSRVRSDGRVEWKHHFAHLAAAPAGEAAAALTDTLSPSGWDDLAQVRAPILLIRGDAGYVTEADAQTFAARVPHAQIETVASGHNVQEQLPAALAARLRQLAQGRNS